MNSRTSADLFVIWLGVALCMAIGAAWWWS